MENETPQLNNPQSAINQEPTIQSPSQSSSSFGSVNRVIQPISNNLEPENLTSQVPTQPTLDPAQVAPTTSGVTPNTVAPQPPNSNSFYPEPQTGFIGSPTGSMPSSDIKKEEKQVKKWKRLFVLLVCLVAVLLVSGGGFYYWYSQQDHSIYAKLTTEKYHQNGISFSFQYPAVIMPVNTKVLAAYKGAKAAYQYQNGSIRIAIIMAVIPFNSILQQFYITPTQELIQLKTGQGSFANAFRAANPSEFSTNYGNCNWQTANSGQQDLVCTHQESSNGGYTVVIVIGADDNYQYDLVLSITNNIYSAHQKVWQKIEKSLNY